MGKLEKYIIVAGLLLIVAIGFSLRGGGILGGALDNLDLNTAGGVPSMIKYSCSDTSTVAVAARSGRSWIRFQNVSSTASIYLSMSTSTSLSITSTPARLGQGIVLTPSGTAGTSHWDSNESGVNWPLVFQCVSDVSGTTMAIIQAN